MEFPNEKFNWKFTALFEHDGQTELSRPFEVTMPGVEFNV